MEHSRFFEQRTGMMDTRLRNRLTALLAAALLSQQAAAMEEVVVIGKDLSEPPRTVTEQLIEAMSAYVSELNEAQKTKLDADLVKLGQQKIQIAAANLPTRG
jgi:hypothetical protein